MSRLHVEDKPGGRWTFTDRAVFVNGDPMMNIQWSDAGDYTDWDSAYKEGITLLGFVPDEPDILAVTREIARET
jgi:hypothetical protein